MFKFRSLVHRFKANDRGHVAVAFGLFAIPILIAVTSAIDMHKSSLERMHLSNALDAAALAAVTNQNLNAATRGEYAETYFWDNLSGTTAEVDFIVVESADARIALEAHARFKPTFLSHKGKGDLRVIETATAEVTFGDVICMMTLDPDDERSFEVTGGARLKAPNCSVQINSKHERAAILDHGGEATAQDFCVSGGAHGNFKPFVNTECRTVEDPFEERRVTVSEPCIDPVALNDKLSTWQAESLGVTLFPGTYCGGLDLNEKKVTFAPGTYFIKDGPFILDRGTRVSAEGVTFVMQGDDAIFQAKEGSKAIFTAPKTGEFAGMAFFQDTEAHTKQFKTLPTGVSTIARGSDITIIGIAYLPDQKIAFRGGSLLDNQAPATSFIGYQISIGDGSNVHVDVDHRAAGIPPIEPRSDESARLSE